MNMQFIEAAQHCSKGQETKDANLAENLPNCLPLNLRSKRGLKVLHQLSTDSLTASDAPRCMQRAMQLLGDSWRPASPPSGELLMQHCHCEGFVLSLRRWTSTFARNQAFVIVYVRFDVC